MKKKVLFVFHESDPLSGGNASMLDAIVNIKKNASFDIIGLVPCSKKNKEDIGIKNVLSDMGIHSVEARYFSSRYQSNTVGFKETVKIIKCIVRNIISILSVFAIYRKIKNSGVSVVYTNTSDLYVGAILSKLLNVKHIWHFREFGYEDQKAHHLMGDRLFYKMSEKYSDIIIVISRALEEKVSKYISKRKIHMIYDDLNFELNKSHAQRCGILRPNFLMVGTLSPGKGQLDVIRSLSLLKGKGIDFNLGIVGHDDSDYAKYLKNEVIKLNLEGNVRFLGFSKDLSRIRENYDIGIVASHSEAFGRVTIEGMLSGLIMVGSRKGANKELISDGSTGFLYDPSNLDGLIEILENILFNKVDIAMIRSNAYFFSKSFVEGNGGKLISNLINEISDPTQH
ncbi:glycosyltransferase family 4 protein [Pectobacterium carotovorum]|uniref:glycosyltransferase family 4 protein n=1 Tax=Pectobacterium carotovorum TaxID=554 RepID=UPI00068970A1|nr:glycosyltransferase family 4 protein [Pectobacterium carotovorum]MBB1527438.1 glycosyltransferase family 4 protein [Pectobacterium carotovorum subsp. carotovorum]MCA6965376.1 glycosyltransferase family 4 protein [Pectobacterium carotovorum]MCH4987800.1 glycosyltransferase family 4 protein [Pectobacterium carotovorum]